MARLSLAVYLALYCGIASCQTDDITLPDEILTIDTYPTDQQDPTVSSCGPDPTIDPVDTLCPLVLPPTSGPIHNLPCPPPPQPVVTATKCQCTKTVVKPKMYQRVITAQKNQRFLKQTYVPVTETIPFVARPSCGSPPPSGSPTPCGIPTPCPPCECIPTPIPF